MILKILVVLNKMKNRRLWSYDKIDLRWKNKRKIFNGYGFRQMNSLEFASFINETFNHYSCITFIICGSDGILENIKNTANLKLSFSKMTMPHGLFRGVLLEQIYRTFKINNNETYHK